MFKDTETHGGINTRFKYYSDGNGQEKGVKEGTEILIFKN